MKNNEKRTKKTIYLHGWLPLLIAVIIVVISLVLDLCSSGKNCFQRAGTIVIILGAYVAFYNVASTMKYNDKLHEMILTLEPTFNIISTLLIVVGTITAGYGDLIISIFTD